jgi:hypothetical protein
MKLSTKVNAARLGAATLALGVLVAPGMAGTINSDLRIEPGKTFQLGGGQPGGFTVTGRNIGPVAVVVLGKTRDAKPAARSTVAPGGEVKARFSPGEQALLRNTSGTVEARLKLKVSGDTSSLGMTYSVNP